MPKSPLLEQVEKLRNTVDLIVVPAMREREQFSQEIGEPGGILGQVHRIVSPIKGFLVVAAAACCFGADAQDLDRAASGFAVAPPAGFVATLSTPASPSRVALHVTKPAEPGVACEVSFEVLPGFEHFSQAMLNRQTDNPDWEAFYRDGLGDFYKIASVERFDHAGVRGAVVSGISKPKPTIRNWAADQPTLIFIFYTPKGLTKITCLAPQPIFEAGRAEFEAVARGITLAQ